MKTNCKWTLDRKKSFTGRVVPVCRVSQRVTNKEVNKEETCRLGVHLAGIRVDGLALEVDLIFSSLTSDFPFSDGNNRSVAVLGRGCVICLKNG